MNNNEEEMMDMFEDFPAGGEPLDIPDVGVGTDEDIDVDALLESMM